jgi:hypothetical protein
MTVGSPASGSLWTRTLVLLLLVVVLVAGAALAYAQSSENRSVPPPPTIAEKLVLLQAERAELQARADSLARIEMLSSFRAASLLFDALAARYEPEREQPFDRLPASRREVFVRLEAVNAALRAALDRPGTPAATAAVSQMASGIPADLEWMASFDLSPVILSYTPMFLTPRRPVPSDAPAPADPVRDDPLIEIEILGLRLTRDRTPPVLTIGSWRGEAVVTPERLKFAVPRSAFAADAKHARFATGALFLRHDSRTVAFQLIFTSIPERVGSFALDQKVRSAVPESNTLVSPEILARAPAGEARTVRRCFDPPPGWRFDKSKRRVVIVERLGWIDDIPDETMNSGSVAFVREDRPSQICVAVVAKAATKTARTATIGRFEATLVRDVATDRVVQSGVRALDWNEPARVPFESGMIEWKLYVRLFDEIDREFEGNADTAAVPSGLTFLHIAIDGDKNLTVRADPEALR